MSEPAFANLPRFDDSEEEAPAIRMRRMMAGAGLQKTESEAPEPEEVPVLAPPVIVQPIDQEVASLKAVIADLSRVIVRVEAEARANSMDITRNLCAQLFPELSRQFLSEEIVRHLPDLLPAMAPSISIHVNPDMVEQLDALIRLHPALEGRCTLVPAENQTGSRTEISWKTGGVTFDFDALLAACLRHI